MLQGIIFVVHLSIGGDKLVFRYPHVSRAAVSQETLVAFKQSTTKSALHHSLPDSSSPPAATPALERRERAGEADTTNSTDRQKHAWYNTPSVVLAPILTPKAQLCDMPFDLTIDDTRFIGHPSLVQKKALEESKFQDEYDTDISADNKDTNTNSTDNKDANNKDTNNISESADNRLDSSSSASSEALGKRNTSKNNTNHNSEHNNSNGHNSNSTTDSTDHSNGDTNNHANGNKATAEKRAEDNTLKKEVNEEGKQDEKKKQDHKDELRLFNVVFAVPASTSIQRANRFKWMAAQIASALLHEQSRCGYLIDQVNVMSSIRDEWLLEQTRKLAEANAATASSRKEAPATPPQSYFRREDPHLAKTPMGGHAELTIRLLKASRLACELRDIFSSISTGNPGMGIRFNNWVTVPLSLQDPDSHSLFPLRPYHTLLLLDTPSHDSQIDRLPALKRLMEAAKPTKTFRELQTETDIPLAQMYRMAAHLVFWGRAKIINIMTKNNTYILSPHNKTTSTNLPSLWREFSKTFPYFNLVEVLASFSVPKPLGEHVRLLSGYSHYRDFVLVVTWLLQKDLIVQLHTYVHLMLAKDPDGNANASSRLSYSTTPVNPTYKYTAPYPSCPQPLQGDELFLLEKLDDGTSTYQLLRRLAPYFRGRHTIEEIMWRENVSREQLTKLFAKHRPILVRVVHEGPDEKDVMGIY